MNIDDGNRVVFPKGFKTEQLTVKIMSTYSKVKTLASTLIEKSLKIQML